MTLSAVDGITFATDAGTVTVEDLLAENVALRAQVASLNARYVAVRALPSLFRCKSGELERGMMVGARVLVIVSSRPPVITPSLVVTTFQLLISNLSAAA
jgi:hypothetical protein